MHFTHLNRPVPITSTSTSTTTYSSSNNFKSPPPPPPFFDKPSLLSTLPLTLLSRNQRSIAYYLNLESKEQKKARQNLLRRNCTNWSPPIPPSPTFATSATSLLSNATRSSPFETRSPRYASNSDTLSEQSFKVQQHRKLRGDELLHRLNSRCLKASLRRTTILRERKLKIRGRLDTVKQRVFLQKHRHNLKLLRARVRHDFAMGTAYLKRQLILQQKTELWGAAVERAQNVALLNRLKKSILLRRAYAERLAELLHASEAHMEGESDTALFTSATKRPKRSFQMTARSRSDIFAPTRPILSLPDSAISFYSTLPDGSFSDDHEAASPVSSCPSSCSTDDAVYERSVLVKPDTEEESDDDLEAEELRFSRWRPPINRDTLAELDLEEMRTNVQLRHDLIFDPNLQFRPNVAGESGLAKQARWENYWETLRLELECTPNRTSLIPILIWEAREIMLTLFPFEEDVCKELSAKMDVSLIAQELEHNVFDVAGFVQWLASTLEIHCASQREGATDDMVDAVKEGKFAYAFRLLFEHLELTKLDIANHQLCNIFRPYVLEHAVQFEWRHFELQLEAGLTTLNGTTRWLSQGLARNPSQDFDETFYDSIVHLVATSTSDTALPVPEAFHMDGSRLHSFHNDYQDISIMATILLLFRQLAGSRCESTHVVEMKLALWTLLVEVGTTMQHITVQVLHSAEVVRQRQFSPSERALMTNLVDKTLSSDSKVFQLVQTRVTKVLKDFLCEERKKSIGATNQTLTSRTRTNADTVQATDASPLSEATLGKYGLFELKDGILDLAVRIQQLAEHNRAVHITSYQSIWLSLNKIDDESEADENNLSVNRISSIVFGK